MSQRVYIYLKEVKVIDNGHYRSGKRGENLLEVTWQRPNFRDAELRAGSAMQLIDFDTNDAASVNTFEKGYESQLFKCEVDGVSRIEFRITNTITVPKSVKWFLAKVASKASPVSAIPLLGSEIVDLLKGINSKVVDVARGTLDVPVGGFTTQDYSVDLVAGEALGELQKAERKRDGTRKSSSRRVIKPVIKKGESNGRLMVSVVVV